MKNFFFFVTAPNGLYAPKMLTVKKLSCFITRKLFYAYMFHVIIGPGSPVAARQRTLDAGRQRTVYPFFLFFVGGKGLFRRFVLVKECTCIYLCPIKY
jgi:hypothetical protein